MPDPIEIIDAGDAPGSKFTGEGFASLTWPKPPREFFDRYWEQRPYCVRRDVPGYFDRLLRLRDVDEYLGTRAFREADIRVVKEGRERRVADYSKDGVADRQKVLQDFRAGAMLLLNHLDRHHLPLAEFVSRCEAEVHVPMRSNVYLSPPDSRGFKLHWDTHDVLVVQVSGAKRWHIHDNPYELPHEDQRRELRHCIGESRKLAEVELRPGSMLFLPRGFVHGAEAADDHSLHITFGLRSMTVADIVLGAFRRSSLEDLDMRRVARLDDYAGPERIEQARAALERVLESMDLEDAVNDVYRSFIASRQPPARGALMEALDGAALDHERRMRLRESALFRIFGKGETVSVAVDGSVVSLPAAAAPALDFVVERRTFTPAELPGLEHESKLILARTLRDCRLVECVE